MQGLRLQAVDQSAYAQAMDTTAPTLSSSEKLTLRYLAEGEIHPRELDWVAIQRLRQAKLIEERPGRPGLTPEGRRAWQGSWARQR
jgi:hypothetical protein